MKNIIALALLVASLGAVPVVSTSAQAVETGIAGHCGPDAPESYKRPGGFCDQAGSNNSLIEQNEDDCQFYIPNDAALVRFDAGVQAAAYCHDYYPELVFHSI